MSDFIVKNCKTRDNNKVDIEIRNGTIDNILPAGECDPANFSTDQSYNANGRLVTAPLIEPHTHLYNALSAGRPKQNQSGTLEEAWHIIESNREGRTKQSVKKRARKVIRWLLSYGVTRVRSHLSVSSVEQDLYTSVEAMLEIREEFEGIIEIQLVAQPSNGFARNEVLYNQMETMLKMGIDIVGGKPHKEDTREKGIDHVHAALELAEKYNCPVDFHVDETDDPHSRFTEVLASKAKELEIGERVVASHTTAMHSYSNAYADKLCRLLAESGVSVITNPLSNSVLQGRYDDYPKRRGHTRIDQLQEAGVTVGIGQDDISDSANPYGDGDPLKTLFHFAHFAHKNRIQDVKQLWDMLTYNNAKIYGIESDNYGLKENNEGSLIVYDAKSPFEAIRTVASRNLVLNHGEILARTQQNTKLLYKDESEVDFSREL